MDVIIEDSQDCKSTIRSLNNQNISVFRIENVSLFDVRVYFSDERNNYASKEVIIKSGETISLDVVLNNNKIIPSRDNHFIINDKKLKNNISKFAFYIFNDLFLLVEKLQ